ncbi:transposase family protein [Micromonospora tarapacensis]|uniref:transposase family protein n=1 Tax=Micromonospora tarapacensis TaxID=2835305 RepID=UPI002F3EC8B1
MKTPVKQSTDGAQLAPDNRAYNRLLRGLRPQGERGFATFIGRWKALRHTTISPRRIGDIVAGCRIRSGLPCTRPQGDPP